MTKPYRRDKHTKNGSVVTGLRMEPALARELTTVAREDARQRGETKDGIGVANLTREVRLLLRLAVLGGATDDPPSKNGVEWPMLTAGLKVDHALATALRAHWKRHGAGLLFVPYIRHLLRTHLGWTDKASRDVEARFAEIAVRRHALMDETAQ